MCKKAIIKLFFLLLPCVVFYNKTVAQNGIDTAALRKLAESMKAQAQQLRKDVNGKKNIDSLNLILGKQQKLLQGFNKGLASFQASADSASVNKLDSLSPQTKKENRVVVNQVMKRSFDTAYTTVTFSISTEIISPDSKEISFASGSSETAVDVYSGTSHTVRAFYNDANSKQSYNQLVAKKILSAAYVEKLFAMQAQGNYSKSLHDNGFTYNESGSQVNAGSFVFSFDELLNAGSVAGGIGVSTHYLSTTSDGHSSAGVLNQGIDGGGITNPKQYAIPGVPDAGKTPGPDNMVITIQKTKNGFRVTGSFSKKEGSTTTKKTFTATIGEPIITYEALIVPVETPGTLFKKWVPKGPNPDESRNEKTGDSVTFKIIVRNKKDTARLYPGTFTAKWALRDVTHYAGYCNNYPAFTNNPITNPDLVFSSSLTADNAFDAAGTNSSMAASAAGKGDKAFVKVVSMDYAAWGKLTAEIVLDNGTAINARPWYSNDYGYLAIPYDLNENKIADYWEDTAHVAGNNYPLAWDGDSQPANQRDNGDGYTLFEEYRGFAVAGYNGANIRHIRTSPLVKDAFVYDADGLFHKYYEALNPSNLSWHYLSADKNQFYFDSKNLARPQNRWVNFNKSDECFYAEQYALVISYAASVYNYDPLMTAVSFTPKEWLYAQNYAATKKSDPALKEAYDKEAETLNVFSSPLKTHIKAEIIRPQIEAKCKFIKDAGDVAGYNAAVESQVANAVLHEIGHCLGIHHHIAENVDGSKLCPMRYQTLDERKDAKLLAARYTKYCRPGDTGPDYVVERDADNETVKETLIPGKTSGDNCYGQITVKCKPGE